MFPAVKLQEMLLDSHGFILNLNPTGAVVLHESPDILKCIELKRSHRALSSTDEMVGGVEHLAHTAKVLTVLTALLQGSPPNFAFETSIRQLFFPIHADLTMAALDDVVHEGVMANEEQSVPLGVPYEANGMAEIICPLGQLRDNDEPSGISP